MTKWVEFPLREAGTQWPGLNFTGGKLMKVRGELGACKNAIINRDDTIEKRLGFVRGFDERFAGVVCGLFAYTSNCGQEFLIVADQSGFSIRTPFSLNVFEIADCYPFDSFSEDGGMNQEKWRNTGRYTQLDDALQLVAGAGGTPNHEDLPGACARWFKDACSRSYRVRVAYAFDTIGKSTQRVVIVLRGNGDLSAEALLIGYLQRSPADQRIVLVHRSAQGNIAALTQLVLEPTDSTNGEFTVSYDATTRQMSATVLPSNASLRSIQQATPFTAVQDADFGARTAIGLAFDGVQPTPEAFTIAVVDGGSL